MQKVSNSARFSSAALSGKAIKFMPSQAGHREVAAATSTAMIGQDVVLALILRLDSGRAFRPGLSERERTRPGIDNKRSNCDQKRRCQLHRKVQLLAPEFDLSGGDYLCTAKKRAF
jgi:hypothetical protein